MTINRQGLSEIEVISDLIRINYARIDCLEQTLADNIHLYIESTKLFIHLIKKCKSNVAELIGLTVLPAHFFPKFLLSPGFIFEVWLERNNSAQNDPASLLLRCECREYAALESYKAALIEEVLVDKSVRELILDQKHDLQVSLDKIRKQADLNDLFGEEPAEEEFSRFSSTFINKTVAEKQAAF